LTVAHSQRYIAGTPKSRAGSTLSPGTFSACGDADGSGPDEEFLDITRTLTTNAGRSATVSGSVSGDRLEATFAYTDGCAGTATTTADLVDERVPPELTGNYTSTDCVGRDDWWI
jgi:hypothetical protein